MFIFKTLLLFILSFTYLYSHPHTFMEIYPTIDVKNGQTTNINFIWKLDEMTSSMLIMEFDFNGNGKIDKEENQFIYAEYFKALRDYNFYTDIKINNKIEKFPDPQNFKAFIENNKVCYSFDIKQNYKIKDMKIDFGDQDFFIAPILKKKFLKITGAKAKITELDNDYYFGYRLELMEKR